MGKKWSGGVQSGKGGFEQRLRNIVRPVYCCFKLLAYDLKVPSKLSVRHTLRAWRFGFLRYNYAMYGLHLSGNVRDFVSDYESYYCSDNINGILGDVVDNKLFFPMLLHNYGIPMPHATDVVTNGLFHNLGESGTVTAAEWISRQLTPGQRMVLKPVFGFHGKGVNFVAHTPDGYEWNGKKVTRTHLVQSLTQLDHHIATEFVQQGEYSARMYPRTTNTIRIVTFWDSEKAHSSIAKAVHRIGSSKSFPVDNFQGGRGGLSSCINIETGELGPGATVDKYGNVKWHNRHPESNAPIRGVRIPNWTTIRNRILECADRLAYAPYIGWDIVSTDKDFTVLECNSTAGMPVMQIHGPLLADSRMKRFYQHHGVIRRSE